MIEAMGAAIEKGAETVIEKTPSFFDRLEQSVEIEKPEVAKREEAIKAFWEDLENKPITDYDKPSGYSDSPDKQTLSPEVVTREKKEGLTENGHDLVKKETGWSDIIINSIDTMKQYADVYKTANLYESEFNGRKCLKRDINFEYVDEKTGLTNRELMKKGRSPIDAKTGERIELHHMGQGFDAPFAELTENSEHGDGNHGTLHLQHFDLRMTVS